MPLRSEMIEPDRRNEARAAIVKGWVICGGTFVAFLAGWTWAMWPPPEPNDDWLGPLMKLAFVLIVLCPIAAWGVSSLAAGLSLSERSKSDASDGDA